MLMTLLNSPKSFPLYFRRSYVLVFKNAIKEGEMLGGGLLLRCFFLFFPPPFLFKRLFERIYLSRIFNKDLQKPWHNART